VIPLLPVLGLMLTVEASTGRRGTSEPTLLAVFLEFLQLGAIVFGSR
jgi:hypothetical protein